MTKFYIVDVDHGKGKRIDAVVNLEQVTAVARTGAGLSFKFLDGTILTINMDIDQAHAHIDDIYDNLRYLEQRAEEKR